jgi:hypothetical protein
MSALRIACLVGLLFVAGMIGLLSGVLAGNGWPTASVAFFGGTMAIAVVAQVATAMGEPLWVGRASTNKTRSPGGAPGDLQGKAGSDKMDVNSDNRLPVH